jgi:hypothetical protein
MQQIVDRGRQLGVPVPKDLDRFLAGGGTEQPGDWEGREEQCLGYTGSDWDSFFGRVLKADKGAEKKRARAASDAPLDPASKRQAFELETGEEKGGGGGSLGNRPVMGVGEAVGVRALSKKGRKRGRGRARAESMPRRGRSSPDFIPLETDESGRSNTSRHRKVLEPVESEASGSGSGREDGPENEDEERVAPSRSYKKKSSEMVPRAKESSDEIRTESESNEKDDLECVTCGGLENPDLLLQCASGCCATLQHVYCVTPELYDMPKGDWLCNSCKQKGGV